MECFYKYFLWPMPCWSSLLDFFSFYDCSLRAINCKDLLLKFLVLRVLLIEFPSYIGIKFLNVDVWHEHIEDFIGDLFWNDVIKQNGSWDLPSHVLKKIPMSEGFHFIKCGIRHIELRDILFVYENFYWIWENFSLMS